MSAEDLEQYESELELQLYREYKDVVGIFTYAVETERRFYLCNAVDLKVRTEGGDVYYEVSMGDAWVWDMYRPARFVKSAKVADLPRRLHRGDRPQRPGSPQERSLSPVPAPAGLVHRSPEPISTDFRPASHDSTLTFACSGHGCVDGVGRADGSRSVAAGRIWRSPSSSVRGWRSWPATGGAGWARST